MEWMSLEKVLWFLQPAKFEVILNFEFHNSDFNWFDLLRVEGTVETESAFSDAQASSWRDKPPTAPHIELDLISHVGEPLPDWQSSVLNVDGGLEIRTSSRQWSYACGFRLTDLPDLDPNKYYWVHIKLRVSKGEVGIGLQQASGGLSIERFVVPSQGTRDVYIPLTEESHDWLIVRNTDAKGESTATIYDAHIVSECKAERG